MGPKRSSVWWQDVMGACLRGLAWLQTRDPALGGARGVQASGWAQAVDMPYASEGRQMFTPAAWTKQCRVVQEAAGEVLWHRVTSSRAVAAQQGKRYQCHLDELYANP